MPATILLAATDRELRDAVGAQLSRLVLDLGLEIVPSENGLDSIDQIGSSTLDIILADMPNLDAGGLVSRVRQKLPEQEIILISQQDDAEKIAAAVRTGASDFLLWPAQESELLEKVSRSLERVALRRTNAKLLGENLQLVRNQAVYQRCLAMLSTLDIEKLQDSCLENLCSVCDAQAGALWVLQEQGELHLQSCRGPVESYELPSRIRMASSDLAGPQAFEVPNKPLTRAFYLPLMTSGELVGVALCAEKLEGEFKDSDFVAAQAVAEFGATGIRNAIRHAAVERMGLRDSETAAYNLAYFIDHAGKEVYKARRYNRVFSMLTLGLDGFERFQREQGFGSANELARSIISSLGTVVRDSDVVARASVNEYYVLLPETDYLGALLLARRARSAIETTSVFENAKSLGLVDPVMGAATFPRDGLDCDDLLETCRTRADEARLSLARKLDLGRLDFWSTVELLLGDSESPKLPIDDRAGPSRRGYLPPGLFSQLQLEIALEIARDSRTRGLLYLGCGGIASNTNALAAFEQLPVDCAVRIYLLGRRAEVDGHAWATPVFLDGDEPILHHEFALLFTENASYALIQRKADRKAVWGFHTSDTSVVDELVTKLQERYDLQPL